MRRRCKSTLNRLELTPARANEQSRYTKVVARQRDIAAWFVKAFLRLNLEPPEEIVLNLDTTDDPIHGQQAGRYFHGYFAGYRYLLPNSPHPHSGSTTSPTRRTPLLTI